MTLPPRTVSDQPAGRIGDGPVGGLPEPTRPRRRPVLILVGVVVAALAAAVVAVALNAVTQTQLVWQTSVAVVRGEPVTERQLEPVEVPAAAAGTLLAASVESQAALTDGAVWATDLPAGQLLSGALTVEGLPIDPGQALVGLRLDPGGFPTVGLRPGDAVKVVDTARDRDTTVLVDRATVEAAVELTDQGPSSPRLVTVQVPQDRAADVAAAAAAGQVALVVVP